MAIVSSGIVEDSRQRDGRRWITERHVDQTGVQHLRTYLADAGFDAAAALAPRATQIAAALIGDELGQHIANITTSGSQAAPVFVHATAVQMRAALRAAYVSATRIEAIMIGEFLSGLTNGQLQTIFGMTAGQVTTLRNNRLTPAANLAASIRLAAGQ